MFREVYQIIDPLKKKEVAKRIVEDQKFRKQYFSEAFFSFCKYYFNIILTDEVSSYHKEWCENMRKWKKSMIIGHRWSWKRNYTMMLIIWSIVYKKRHHLIIFAFTETKARERLWDVVSQLKTNKRLIEDFWKLFPTWKKLEDEDIVQKWLWEFITTNKIKVKSLWITGSLRWANYSNQEWSFRPDFLVLDDVDVTTSVRNKDVIDWNFDILKKEIFWALTANAQVIFLWNIIWNDWLVPRQEAQVKFNPKWYYSRIPVIENWKITWNRYVLTDQEEKEYKEKWITKISLESIKREEEEDWYLSNYMLIPNIRSWNPVFDSNQILTYKEVEEASSKEIQEIDWKKIFSEWKYIIDSRYKDMRIYRPWNRKDYYSMWVDTAKWWPKWDFSTIVVRDDQDRLCLCYQSRIPPDTLALVIDYIVDKLWYEKILIWIESNNTWISTIDVAKTMYWHWLLYKEKEVDTITNKTKRKYWFSTTWKSKQLIIWNLEKAIRENKFDILDKREKDDFVNYYYDDSGSTNALSGKFDDLVIAEAICLYMNKQSRSFNC